MPFYKNKSDKEYYHEYYIKNKNQIREKRKIYYEQNKDYYKTKKILELKPFIYSNNKTIDIIKDDIKIPILEGDIKISVLEI